MSFNIVGIDTGSSKKKKTLGVSLFSTPFTDSGSAVLVATRAFVGGQGWLKTAREVFDWAVEALLRRGMNAPGETEIDLVIVEIPYMRGRDDRLSPDVRMEMAGVGAAIGAYLRPFEMRTVAPREWKGTLDGDTFIQKRILPALTSQELARCGLTSHERDAAGLVLWNLGRLEPKRIFPT